MKRIYILTVLAFLSTVALAQYAWVNKQQVNATKRHMCAAFEINGKGYIVGGKTSSTPITYQNDTWEYDPANDTWTAKAAHPYNFAWPGYFSIGGLGYVVGGQDNGHVNYVNTMNAYNPVTNTWTPKAAHPANGIGQTFQFVINGLGYVGAGTNNAAQPSADMYAYNPNTNTWTAKASYPGQLSIDAVGFAIDSFGYAGLGGDGVGNAYKAFYKYNSVTNTWSAIADFPGRARLGAMAFVLNKKAYVGGGICYLGDSLYSVSDFYEYDPNTNTWTPAPGLPGAPRAVAGNFSIGNSGYLVGGHDWLDAVYYKYVSEFTTCDNLISGGVAAPAEDLQQMRVFPNPASQELNVAIDGFVRTKLNYEVVTTEGRLVKQGMADNGNFNISIKDLAQGMYYLNMKDGSTRYAAQSFAVIK